MTLNDHFHTDDLKQDLRRRSVHGGVFTFASQGAKFVLTVASTMILARLLTPHDFGLVAMVAALTGFAVIFRDLGLATATVQSESIDQAQVSTLHWLSVLCGLALAILVMLLSPLLAVYFKEPGVTAVGVAMGSRIFIEGLGIQHQALLRRRMRFGALALIEVGSYFAGVIVAVVLALHGFEYWSLVLLLIVNSFVRVACLWIVCDWRPGWAFCYHETRSLVAFGGKVTVTRFIRYVSLSVDRLLIGRVLGPQILGLYSKASGWLVAPVQNFSWPAARLAVPVLSRLQNEPARFRTYYRTGMSIIASIGMPVIAYLFVDAPTVILLLLGDQWISAIPIFRLLAPVAFATLFFMGFQWCFVSLGNAGRQLRWEALATCVTIVAFAIGLRWGAEGVAAAYSIASLVLVLPAAIYCYRGSPIRPGDLIGAFWRSTSAGAGAGLLLYLLTPLVPIEGLPATVILHGAVFCVAYALMWIGLPGGGQAAIELLRLGKELQKLRRMPP